VLISPLAKRSLLCATVLTLSACGSSNAGTVAADPSLSAKVTTPAEEVSPFDNFGATRSADAGASAQEFHGYACTVDCSGHEAGYAWAEEHGIDDPDECDGNSESFIEGCQTYAEEQGEGLEDADSLE
jgi:hypothetical protein